MDIGEAFLSSKREPSGPRQETCYLTRYSGRHCPPRGSRLCVASFHAAPRPEHVPTLFRRSPDAAQRVSGALLIRAHMRARWSLARSKPRSLSSGILLGLQNLAALVHAGLQIEVVGTAQFTGILVLYIGWLLQCICRAAHATPRGRCFSSGNGHVGVL